MARTERRARLAARECSRALLLVTGARAAGASAVRRQPCMLRAVNATAATLQDGLASPARDDATGLRARALISLFSLSRCVQRRVYERCRRLLDLYLNNVSGSGAALCVMVERACAQCLCFFLPRRSPKKRVKTQPFCSLDQAIELYSHAWLWPRAHWLPRSLFAAAPAPSLRRYQHHELGEPQEQGAATQVMCVVCLQAEEALDKPG